MNCAPWLPVSNRFSVLANEYIVPHEPKTESLIPVAPEPPKILQSVETPKPPSRRVRKWEKCLPKAFILAATPGPKSLTVKVSLQSTDTAEVFATPALVDCGTTGQFIDQEYVRKHRLTTRKLVRNIPVFNVDGTRNEAGSIKEVVDVILRFEDHTERTTFAVTSLGSQAVILGFTWLEEHNPEIDWQTRKVKMSRCPEKCQTCHQEVNAERR